MTVINLEDNLMGFDRYNGGWVKTITGIDKDYQNGYSLNGDFVANKRVKNVDLKEKAKDINESLKGRGGGSKTMISGSVKASKDEIIKYFAD